MSLDDLQIAEQRIVIAKMNTKRLGIDLGDL